MKLPEYKEKWHNPYSYWKKIAHAHCDVFLDNGYTKEEMKAGHRSHKNIQ